MERIPLALALLVSTFALLSAACQGGTKGRGGGASGRVSPTYNGPSETSFCSDTISYGDSVTITGTATYQRREPSFVGLGAAGSARAIRYAEVRVTDGDGAVVQCAETSSTGTFSFTLPRGGSSYTVSINSRAKNTSMVVASVLDRPERNRFYSLSTTVTAASSGSVGTLNAGVTGEILGAAFNILDQIFEANEFLRSKVGTCAISGCQSVSGSAPKVVAYWEKGFNPNSYFGESSGLSFYLPGYSRLFILGGIDGNTDTADTDHFDNSIVLHEYGHFLEDIYTITDSPGGSHSGNANIDPRLAWGEGWGNFIQAAVRNDPYYIDTRGNVDGDTAAIFYVELETYGASNNCDSGKTAGQPGYPGTPGCDRPESAGEGNFREFAITRFLWDVFDTSDDSPDTVDDQFNIIWAALTNSTTGFKNSSTAFRDIGLLHLFEQSVQGSAAWDSLQTSTASSHRHYQVADRTPYAFYVDNVGSCSLASSPYTIVPTAATAETRGGSYADLNRNSDFFFYKHSGGAFNLTLQYDTPSGTEADLDLYVYDESGRIGVDLVGLSAAYPDGNIGTLANETVTIASLAAGNYLIHVKVYPFKNEPYDSNESNDVAISSDLATISYELYLSGGQRLCSATNP